MQGEAGQENQSMWDGSLPNLHDSMKNHSYLWMRWAVEPTALQNSLTEGGRERDLSASSYRPLLYFHVLPLERWILHPMVWHFIWVWKSGRSQNLGLGLGPGAVAAPAPVGVIEADIAQPAQGGWWWQKQPYDLGHCFFLQIFFGFRVLT